MARPVNRMRPVHPGEALHRMNRRGPARSKTARTVAAWDAQGADTGATRRFVACSNE